MEHHQLPAAAVSRVSRLSTRRLGNTAEDVQDLHGPLPRPRQGAVDDHAGRRGAKGAGQAALGRFEEQLGGGALREALQHVLGRPGAHEPRQKPFQLGLGGPCGRRSAAGGLFLGCEVRRLKMK